jgi:hypothetical protein
VLSLLEVGGGFICSCVLLGLSEGYVSRRRSPGTRASHEHRHILKGGHGFYMGPLD